MGERHRGPTHASLPTTRPGQVHASLVAQGQLDRKVVAQDAARVQVGGLLLESAAKLQVVHLVLGHGAEHQVGARVAHTHERVALCAGGGRGGWSDGGYQLHPESHTQRLQAQSAQAPRHHPASPGPSGPG